MFSFKSIIARVRTKGVRTIYESRIGNRDIVGHGCNGQPVYKDDAHFPFPAIRFKENTEDLKCLREKEKGDWNNLSKEEKKELYRASFCQTFAEFQHPTGQWKLILGCVLFSTSFAFWCQTFYRQYVAEPLPWSATEEGQRAQLRRILDLHVNPIDGIASLWDYEKEEWKK
ncbi:hypothetical protein O0L34_g10214 [Tuta absoluta]|nr:hypothetical protein O0L34_g10214 [Tuta absoluta]